jgi:hypothetical protein
MTKSIDSHECVLLVPILSHMKRGYIYPQFMSLRKPHIQSQSWRTTTCSLPANANLSVWGPPRPSAVWGTNHAVATKISSGHGDKFPESIKVSIFLEYLSDYWLLKEDSILRSDLLCGPYHSSGGLVAGFQPRRPGFEPGSGRVG